MTYIYGITYICIRNLNIEIMKTLSNIIAENQLVANIVRSELNRGRIVYLVINNRTGNTAVTSQPKLFGGDFVSGGIALIAGDENGMGGDTYSTPIDQIETIKQLEVPFKVIDVEEVKLVVTTSDRNKSEEIQIAFEERNNAEWSADVKQYSNLASNIEEVKTHIQFSNMFDYNVSFSDFKILIN